ncbi:LEAF RUST 10 DISEASE-RESISTANCE LOCUS RECEPTOR-LIKE PROTEIN KINASE-like 2.3 [Solanum dulcamara]|uniref:LEAF RUST 10 DISEASE-RESISTANCE LOCUS RECEPTOR-LIKE PROTEIN KINASE-like 2.3 n=1 Tax=Solanum dulcamara TaxID=45834 RepID=UPI0024866B9B|nr:LEAF RUST 10 DISEASE-RESISTANCE LOCUS RECEPTOR-LIKE PROTEIN KINASE-like 2.3 [Solanum dulcamara]
MDQLEGFLAEEKEDHVCQLKKSLCGLKQSLRQWYKRFDAFMTTHGFSRSAFDSCVYYKKMSSNSMIYLLLYVDDMLIAANNITEINILKKLLSKEFDMKDLEAAKKIFGMEISRENGILHLSQKRYIKKFEDGVEHQSKIPYASTIGSIMYAMVCTHPDIAQFVSVKKGEDYKIVKAFLKNHGSLVSRKYSYSEVKKMTEYFKNKLDQGGYGFVYKGKLHNGSLVAVKVLKESKGRGEEFINEVASISRTSHINIVSLVGFCFEGQDRALIYDFMPNGSLEKFIFDAKSGTNRQLGWKTLYNILLGIARGLEYLHH